jgi:hypothetical protein
MAMIFRYIHLPRADKTLRRAPFIPIFAHDINGKLVEITALIDSGADNIVIPKDLAQVLGLTMGEEFETAGVGGKTKVRRANFTFTIKKGRESHTITAPSLVLLDNTQDVPVLLGRNGFFEEFEITFRQNDEKIVLKKISKQAY